jgi:hypothetical protein
MNDIFADMFSSMGKLYSEQRELAAIWLNKALVTGQGRTSRIAPENTVRIENGEMVDITPEKAATHKVIGCIGTLYNQFELTVISLSDNSPSQIKL